MDTRKQEGVQVYVVCFSKQNTMNHAVLQKRKKKTKNPAYCRNVLLLINKQKPMSSLFGRRCDVNIAKYFSSQIKKKQNFI